MLSPLIKHQAGLLFKDLALGHIKSHDILIASLDLLRAMAERELELLIALDRVMEESPWT
jgi:hypothetical protein